MSDDPIRILIVGMPRLLLELVERAVSEQTGMSVVATSTGLAGFAETVETTKPEFAIVPIEDAELPRECRELFAERARVKVIGIGPIDGHAYLYTLRPERVTLGEISPDDVVEAIRAASTSC